MYNVNITRKFNLVVIVIIIIYITIECECIFLYILPLELYIKGMFWWKFLEGGVESFKLR